MTDSNVKTSILRIALSNKLTIDAMIPEVRSSMSSDVEVGGR